MFTGVNSVATLYLTWQQHNATGSRLVASSSHTLSAPTFMPLPFDTFENVDYKSFDCVEAIAGFVFGAMSAQNFLSVVITGPVSSYWPYSNTNWDPGIDSDNNMTTYFLRSWPKGRIGKPLEGDEIRMTSFYVEDRKNSISKIVIVLSFLVGDIDMDEYRNTPARESHSVNGVPLLSITSFDDQTDPCNRIGTCARSSTGHRMIMTSTVQVMNYETVSSFRAGNHDFAVASIVAGVPIVDSVRLCFDITTEHRHEQSQISLLTKLKTSIAMRRPEFTQRVVKTLPNPTSAAAFALKSSRIACDMLSAAGLVDIIASPIADGALPDAMLHPLCLPLALTLLARMAAKPEKYQLRAGTPNDVYAARELSELMESQFNPILRYYDGDPLWAIDVCAIVALTQIKSQLLKIKKKKDREAEEMNVERSMSALFSLGIGLCNDVIGCTIPDDIYTDFGMASNMSGPIETARAKAGATRGLGKLGNTVSSMRVSCRADRQRAMVEIMCEVEEFLRSGRCKKLQLAAGAVAGHETSVSQNEDGFVEIPSFERCDPEATLGRATSRDAFLQAREQLQNLLLRGPMVLNSFTLSTYVASNYSKVPCVECGSDVDVFGGLVFAHTASKCSSCCGKRCWQCAMLADARGGVCKRCIQPERN